MFASHVNVLYGYVSHRYHFQLSKETLVIPEKQKINPTIPLFSIMAQAVKSETRANTSHLPKQNHCEHSEDDAEMKKKNTTKTAKKGTNAAKADDNKTSGSKGKFSSKATQCEPSSQMHLSIRELLVDENNKVVGSTHVEQRFENLNRKATVDSVMDMINKNQMPNSMKDVLLPWYKKQQEQERLIQSEACSATSKFVSAQTMLNKLPTKQRKVFVDFYEQNLLKQEKLDNERIMEEILREANNSKEKLKVAECVCDKAQIKKGYIKVRDDKDLLQPKIVGKGELSTVNFDKCDKDVKDIKDTVDATPVRPKENKAKQLKIDEVCRNTINLLKFQRTHSVTYMHDILPFLRAMYKEYKSKETSSISPHEILVLDQIAYNVEFYWKITNTEKLYKETMLDGHIWLSRHITKLIEGFLTSLNSKDRFKEICGNFIYLMDSALEKIHEIDLEQFNKQANSDICEDVLEIIKEILCTAYSIALVCKEYESNSIKGTSKTILDDLNAIKTEINKSTTNVSMCNLLIDSFCDNLCALERKVNVTVLYLTVETFANYENKINQLYFQCTDNKTKDTTNKDSIDECVGRVDNEMDKIMQIGWFAISCSGYSKHSRNLRNALASIEALEEELVPGLVTMKKRANETYMEIIARMMLKAVKNMKNALYNIIDPIAFCWVLRIQVEKTVANLKEVIGKNLSCHQEHHKSILRCYEMAQDMISNSIDTDKEDYFQICQLQAMSEANKNIKKVLDEIKKRIDQLPLQSDNLELQLKIIKRYKVIRHEFSKLIQLAYSYGEDPKEDLIPSLPPKSTTIEENKDINKTTKLELELIEVKAQKIQKNRSIIANAMMMNNTLLKLSKHADDKIDNTLLKLLEKRTPESHFWSFNNEVFKNNKDIEITSVLKEICNKSRY